MRTAAYKDDAASSRRRHQNVPRHILCSIENCTSDDFYKGEIK